MDIYVLYYNGELYKSDHPYRDTRKIRAYTTANIAMGNAKTIANARGLNVTNFQVVLYSAQF